MRMTQAYRARDAVALAGLAACCLGQSGPCGSSLPPAPRIEDLPELPELSWGEFTAEATQFEPLTCAECLEAGDAWDDWEQSTDPKTLLAEFGEDFANDPIEALAKVAVVYTYYDSGLATLADAFAMVDDIFEAIGGCDLICDDSQEDEEPDTTGGGVPTGETVTLNLGGGVNMVLIRIPAGTFLMGSENGFWYEEPVHSVTITQDFYLGKYEVTQAQYEAVTGTNPSFFDGCDDCPVETVSWDDAVDFAETLSGMSGYDVRLPTEAEWEYACRAGTTTDYYFGGDESQLGDYAWYSSNSGFTTHPVGQKIANNWGLYDMHGNVWEQCNDWFDYDYYDVSPPSDPPGPTLTGWRVIRGGAFNETDFILRSAERTNIAFDDRGSNGGFRLAAGT